MTIAVERINSKRSFVWLRYSHHARFSFVSQFVQGKTVLDLASGEATSSYLFLAAGATRVLAADLSTETLAEANRHQGGDRIDFLACDATLIPLPDQSIDVFSSLETIEHIQEDDRYLAEAARLVREDGYFLVSTPNRTLTNPGRSLSDKPWNPFHVREYSLAEFRQLLESVWTDVEIFGQYPRPAFWFRMLASISRDLPGYSALHFLQFLKLLRLIYDSPGRYQYELINPDKEYEDFLAVCRRPRK